jgi:hypothetical protein
MKLGTNLIAAMMLACACHAAEAIAADAAMSGRDIYERVLDNRYRRGMQEVRVISRDPGGSEQETRFTVSLEDCRDAERNPTDGVLAKMLTVITEPFDMRHTTYLMISKRPGPDDEFVYQPSQLTVRRVDLKRTPLLGTDYTFDDIGYHDIDGADYLRLPDEVHDGVPVYVVEAEVLDEKVVETHRTISYIETEHFIPLRIRYWDEFGVETKEMTAVHATIRDFGPVWVATRSRMRDLLQGTSSTSNLLSLDPNPYFSKSYFSAGRLSRGK